MREARLRKIPYDFSYMWTLKKKQNQMNKQNRNRIINRTNSWLPEDLGVGGPVEHKAKGELRGTNLWL